ncbi:hypothetical protein VOI32_14090 [Paraburkholderia caribensis]|uniref:Uncharacterized protein n=1 Tax=Paraburkholderia caribensis TaxID=75105 RepID=A0A9Q6RZ78_9BURK|nr:hypothetical protein [Paraburkholderia caribensis]MCO4881576.1 hypothetical protein [Paraburkholderia caribensis]PTB23729.1 hypothetical protein C9I56_37630 [Paraburkholderia caribensis]QLB61628.1 hypothetical protein A9O66_04045 [Paraburkholderia caribensis]
MEFEYTRKRGQKRAYRVYVRLTGGPSLGFEYRAWVYHDEDFKGQLTSFPLTATDAEAAIVEARERVERDIEDLVGINE